MPHWLYHFSDCEYILNYRDEYSNNAPVIILIHGLGVDGQSWHFQEAALGHAGFRPIIPDLPGFGASTFDKNIWSIENISEIMVRFAAHFSQPRMDVIGISLGGAIAMRMMADHQRLFGRLVLINSFSKIRPTKLSNAIFMISRLFRVMFLSIEDQAVYMAGKLFPNQEDSLFREMIVNQITQTDPDIYKKVIFTIGTTNLDAHVKRINSPCLMITGGDDSTILPELQIKLANMINDCRQVLIPNAGHAVIVQKPEEVNTAILELIKSCPEEHRNMDKGVN